MKLLKILAFLCLLGSIAELTFRVLGIGNNVELVYHPTIEYYNKPNKEYRTFGKVATINSAGMRCKDIDDYKRRNKKVILVVGDSVVFGGLTIDQNFISTSLFEDHLKSLGVNASVCNVSATSWGPGNWLNYFQEFGFFGAQKLILVVSSHDAYDVPASIPHAATKTAGEPDIFMRLNVLKALRKYISPLANNFIMAFDSSPEYIDPYSSQALISRCVGYNPLNTFCKERANKSLDDLSELLELAHAEGVFVSAVQFWDKKEIKNRKQYTVASIMNNFFMTSGVPVTQFNSVLPSCGTPSSNLLFIDFIHPFTEPGMKCLAESYYQSYLSQAERQL